MAVLSLLRILGNSLQLRLVHEVELKNTQAKIFRPMSYLISVRRVSAGDSCRNVLFPFRSLLLHKCKYSHMGLGSGLCGDVSRNPVSLSGPQGLPRLWSLPVQSIWSNPKINRNCPLPHCKRDSYERKKFYFSKLGTESICSREEAGN